MSVIFQRQLLKSSIIVSAACLGFGSFAPSALAIVFDFGDSTRFTDVNNDGLTFDVKSDDDAYTIRLSGYRIPNADPPQHLSFDVNNNSNGDGTGILMAQIISEFGIFPVDYQFDLTLTEAPASIPSIDIYSIFIRQPNSLQIPTVQFSSTPSSSERSADFFNANASSTNPVSFNLQIPSQNPTPSPTRLGLNQTVTITGVPLKQNLSAAAEGRLAGFEAQPVPWETDVLPLVGATLLFGGGVWWKRRRAAASQLDLTGQGLEQESGRE